MLTASNCVFKLFKAGVTTAYSALNVLKPLKTVHEKRIVKRKSLSFIFFRDRETIKKPLNKYCKVKM